MCREPGRSELSKETDILGVRSQACKMRREACDSLQPVDRQLFGIMQRIGGPERISVLLIHGDVHAEADG